MAFDLQHILEAVLFAANRPLSVAQLQAVFPDWERPERSAVEQALAAIAENYRECPVRLQEVASGFRFQVDAELSPWVGRLYEERPPKYSRALLETLAIIAYRQPVTRGEIEEIRGVAVSTNIVRTLLDREWVRVVAHKEVPGRPALYGTTKEFLDYFNLKSLDELPTLKEIQDIADLEQETAQNDANEESQIEQEADIPPSAKTRAAAESAGEQPDGGAGGTDPESAGPGGDCLEARSGAVDQ